MAEVILPIEPSYDQWGNLLFKDHTGKDWKIGKGTAEATQEKRKVMGQVILDAAADEKFVSLTMASFQGKPYIDWVELAGDKLAEVREPGKQDMSAMEESAKAGEHLVEAAKKEGGVIVGEAPKYTGQEIGMWWKEVGECLRSGYTKDKAIEAAYKKRMLEVTGIKLGE